jgi:oxygen-independent coproporphyrinogen III oxidase
MEDLGLYIHIPFCRSKCYYCDFNSYSNKEYLQDRYVDSVIKEIELRSEIINNHRIKSIFIGGGTPTYLNYDSLFKLLSYLNKNICEVDEFSCEANPGTLTNEKLKLLKECGVNRLSIGLQSWNDNILKSIGRIHNTEEFLSNYDRARKLGFDNINIDIMFSIYGQTIKDLENTLENVIALKPEHISCYSLIIEEGTLVSKKVNNGEIEEVDEETDREMYYLAVDKLKKAGYERYEISNFALPGFECRHNIIYWKTKPYLGIGAGAHSFIADVRFSNEESPETYIEKIETKKLPVSKVEMLTYDDRMSEFMFMGLRMDRGIEFDEFKARFGKEMRNVYGLEIDNLNKKGLINLADNRIKLTEVGIDLSNQVFVDFLK